MVAADKRRGVREAGRLLSNSQRSMRPIYRTMASRRHRSAAGPHASNDLRRVDEKNAAAYGSGDSGSTSTRSGLDAASGTAGTKPITAPPATSQIVGPVRCIAARFGSLLDVRTRGVCRALVGVVVAALAGAACAHADVGADADAGVPVPIVEGIRHVREEVAGVRTLDSVVPWPQVAAESALTYVQSRLSPAVFVAMGGGDDLEAAFARQAGLCGQIVEPFMQILRGAGVDVLPVQFFYVLDGTRRSHVARRCAGAGAGITSTRPGACSSSAAVACCRPSRCWRCAIPPATC